LLGGDVAAVKRCKKKTGETTMASVAHTVISDDLMNRFRRIALASDRSLAAQLRCAIREHVERIEKAEKATK
jgi:predicted transcriptional regulator